MPTTTAEVSGAEKAISSESSDVRDPLIQVTRLQR